jgi:hypothetical protein
MLSILVMLTVLFASLTLVEYYQVSSLKPVTETSTVTTTVTLPPPVRLAVSEWVYDLQSRDVTSLANLYAPNANATWTGAAGLSGTYIGVGNIKILYGSTLGKYTGLAASLANYSQKTIGPSAENVTFILTMKASSTVVGAVNITAHVAQDWNNSGGQWQVYKENWNYTIYNQQFMGTTTTFPQWGVARGGGNPDLVSEKSIEWHAGPLLSASIYAFLSAVVFLFSFLWFLQPGREKGRAKQLFISHPGHSTHNMWEKSAGSTASGAP